METCKQINIAERNQFNIRSKCRNVQQPNRVSKILRVWPLNFFHKLPLERAFKVLRVSDFSLEMSSDFKNYFGF